MPRGSGRDDAIETKPLRFLTAIGAVLLLGIAVLVQREGRYLWLRNSSSLPSTGVVVRCAGAVYPVGLIPAGGNELVWLPEGADSEVVVEYRGPRPLWKVFDHLADVVPQGSMATLDLGPGGGNRVGDEIELVRLDR